MSSSKTAADPPNTLAVDAGGGTLSTPENVEPVHSSSSKVEVVGDTGMPVIEPAAFYRNGEVVDVDCTIVNTVDSFEVPAGHVRKGARERSFMYSVGVYAEKMERDFSACGNLLTKSRSRMDTFWVELVMFC